mgnify:CR=1 FL=1
MNEILYVMEVERDWGDKYHFEIQLSITIFLLAYVGSIFRNIRGADPWHDKASFRLPLFALLVVMILSIIRVERDGDYLLHQYLNGNYILSEGVVAVENKQDKDGHSPPDLVHVGSSSFRIQYYSNTDAYKQTIENGGVLREGAKVRVYSVEDKIIRIDALD